MSDMNIDNMNVIDEAPDGDSYLASLSDLMVGMLFVFILMLMAFALTYRTARQENEESTHRIDVELQQQKLKTQDLEKQTAQLAATNSVLTAAQTLLSQNDAIRQSMLRKLKQDLLDHGLQVIIDEKNGVLRLPDDLLFDSGVAELRDTGKEALNKLSAVMASLLPCYAKAEVTVNVDCPSGARPVLEAIYVEGHTDDRPIHGIFENNWSLSTARAVNTYEALTLAEPTLLKLEDPEGRSLLGVSGYGEQRPVASNDTPEGRAQNRRIDLRFLLAAPSADEIKRIQEQTLSRYSKAH